MRAPPVLERALIDVGLCRPSIALQAHPVTTLKVGSACSPRGSRPAQQVAAGDKALAYALTGGLIRVVNLENGGRTLLRSHTADVCAVQVCGADVLCSAAVDGTVVFEQLDLVSSGYSSRSGSFELLKLCLTPGCIRISCSPAGLCAVTNAGHIILVDVAAAKLAAPECMASDEPAPFDPALLPECASATTIDDYPGDIALSPSGSMLAVLTDAGDVFVGSICGRALEPQTFTEKIELDDHACVVNALAWAANDLLVCAVGDTGALYLGEVTADGVYTSTQRIEIAAPSAFWLAPGLVSDDPIVALCGVDAPVLLRLNVDLQRRCVGSTTVYSLEAPAACIATVFASSARTNAFVVDALGISRYVIEHGETHFTTQSLPGADAQANAATNERMVALFSSKFDEIKRLVLQSRAEAESKLQAQGAALRRALADELRECVRTSLSSRLDRALNESLGGLEHVVCSGMERMNAEVTRASGIVAEMAERHEQMLAELAGFAADRASGHILSVKVDETHSTRDELRRLIAEQHYEDAFSIVLGNSDVELLSWLCSQLRPEDVFSGSPLTMGQEVIISLAQQLGCDLHRDTSAKAVWIRDAVLALNCSDPVLLPHIQAVLSDLYAQLEHEALECEASAQSELRLCMRVIKTQLRD